MRSTSDLSRRPERDWPSPRCCLRMYRYRLVDEADGADIGPLISARLTFAIGETIARSPDERFEVVPENDNFRAYVIVRRLEA
jgi:hypothetical protein